MICCSLHDGLLFTRLELQGPARTAGLRLAATRDDSAARDAERYGSRLQPSPPCFLLLRLLRM